ncbi:MAG: glycosyltransferase, partial [Patescibacteria group bacterium]
RSWLKGVEYMAAGIPWLATRSATYEGLAHHGTMVENSMDNHAQRVDNWTRALDTAIQNIEARKKLALEKKKWVLKRMTMEGRVQEYVETFERIGNLKRANQQKAILPGVIWNKAQVPQNA